jgi:hypothetical protein
MGGLDIPDDCWDAPTIGDLLVGDICERVPLAVLVNERIEYSAYLDEEDLGDFSDTPFRDFVPVRFSFGLVIGHMTSYSVVCAVGTAPNMPDEATYASLVESGRWARSHVRLPPIPNYSPEDWTDRDGLAFLSHIESFPTATLLPLRVGSMTEEARETLQRRVSQAVSYD